MYQTHFTTNNHLIYTPLKHDSCSHLINCIQIAVEHTIKKNLSFFFLILSILYTLLHTQYRCGEFISTTVPTNNISLILFRIKTPLIILPFFVGVCVYHHVSLRYKNEFFFLHKNIYLNRPVYIGAGRDLLYENTVYSCDLFVYRRKKNLFSFK